MKVIDTPQDTSGRAHQLKALGINAVAFYLRSDRSSLEMVSGLKLANIQRISIFEEGRPTHGSYFTTYQGAQDSRKALAVAQNYHQPKDTPIFFTVDYDCPLGDAQAVQNYFTAVHTNLKNEGYFTGIYGNGRAINQLMELGLAHFSWLSGSTGFEGYSLEKPKAHILQIALDQKLILPEVKDINDKIVLPTLQLDVDYNLIRDWMVTW